MELKIKENDTLRTYKGNACVFAITRGEESEGGFIGEKIEVMALVFGMVKKIWERSDEFEKMAFIRAMVDQMGGVEIKEVDHAETI